MEPSIAVITPVRNGLAFLPGAIESVRSQSYSPLEFVIVDDGSTDGSLEYARNAGVRVLATSGTGPAAARNAGIRATASDLIAFLDVDDLWPPGTLRRLSQALVAHPEDGFAQGLVQDFRLLGNGSKQFFTRPYRFLYLGACLYRRSLFHSVGFLDETMHLHEDLDFFMRCWEQDIRRTVVDEVTLYYRRHPNNMTTGLNGAQFGAVQAFKRRIDRIRRGLYNPSQPRHVAALEYLGVGPEQQDEEVLR